MTSVTRRACGLGGGGGGQRVLIREQSGRVKQTATAERVALVQPSLLGGGRHTPGMAHFGGECPRAGDPCHARQRGRSHVLNQVAGDTMHEIWIFRIELQGHRIRRSLRTSSRKFCIFIYILEWHIMSTACSHRIMVVKMTCEIHRLGGAGGGSVRVVDSRQGA